MSFFFNGCSSHCTVTFQCYSNHSFVESGEPAGPTVHMPADTGVIHHLMLLRFVDNNSRRLFAGARRSTPVVYDRRKSRRSYRSLFAGRTVVPHWLAAGASPVTFQNFSWTYTVVARGVNPGGAQGGRAPQYFSKGRKGRGKGEGRGKGGKAKGMGRTGKGVWAPQCSWQIDASGRRTFAVAESTTWNLVTYNLRESAMRTDCFRRTVKTFLFEQYYQHIERIRCVSLATMRYISRHCHWHWGGAWQTPYKYALRSPRVATSNLIILHQRV